MEIIKTLILPVVFICQEIIFHLFIYHGIDHNIIYTILFAFFAGMICNAVIYCFKKKYYKIFVIFFTSVSSVILCAQLIYHKIFKVFFSVGLAAETGGDAMEFASVGFNTFFKALPAVILIGMFIPLEAVLIKKDNSKERNKRRFIVSFANLLAGITLYMLTLVGMAIGGKESYSAYGVYFDDASMEMRIEKLGAFTAMTKDITNFLFGVSKDVDIDIDNSFIVKADEENKTDNDKTQDNNAENDKSTEKNDDLNPPENKDGENDNNLKDDKDNKKDNDNLEGTDNRGENNDTKDETGNQTEDKNKEDISTKDNILDIDFDTLIANETDKNIKKLHEYFSLCTPTNKNEYTGKFKDYNLIVITAEGFSNLAVDKDVTPTLYKLVNEGFVFENFYNPIWQTSTSDGEYAACTGLIPTLSNNMKKSAKNSMPFCLGWQFSKLNYTTKAYHNHSYTYYSRNLTHPNLGYEFIAPGHGMEITKRWPESDLEMMQNVISQFIDKEPFHTYFMTVSGHLEYSFTGNSMASKNKDYVADLDYSTPCKAYLACQKEFDLAMEYLINELINAGIAERTLIIICGDHYPYGLETESINELAGHDVEQDFELYKSNLIMWSYSMKEPVEVKKYCSSIDILPTILNLFGIEYDSRLFNGKDIFSDSSPLVVFKNKSFITDKIMYNARTNKVTMLTSESLPDDYVKNMQKEVKNAFNASTAILNYDYYSYIKDVIKD